MGRSRRRRWRKGWEARGAARSRFRRSGLPGQGLLNAASYSAKSAMVIASGHVTPLALPWFRLTGKTMNLTIFWCSL
jgi:hypothetical protein